VNCRERVINAVEHRSTETIPWHFNFNTEVVDLLAAHYGSRDIGRCVGNHMAEINTQPLSFWQEVRPGCWQDSFGVVWNRTVEKDIGLIEDYPLADGDLSGYSFPDPDAPGRFDGFAEFCTGNRDLFRLAHIGFSLFERAWTLRGMTNLLMDMVDNPDFVDRLFDAITDYNLAIIERVSVFDIDAVCFGDDWGQQHGLIMGPNLWRRFIKPRLARTYKAVHDRGMKVFIHSCGDVREIIPDLIETGVDVFNPFQPEVTDIHEMKSLYGDRLAFWGGISVQQLMPFGSPDEVRRVVLETVQSIGSHGGYIMSPAHAMTRDVPLENILALVEVARGQFEEN